MSLKIRLTPEALKPDDVILVLRPVDDPHAPPADRRLARLLKALLRGYGFHNIGCRDAKYGFPELGLQPVQGPDGCTGAGCQACAAEAA